MSTLIFQLVGEVYIEGAKMQHIIDFVNSIPEFMWNNIFTVLNTLICGLIVALFTSTFLKKKEERTRIARIFTTPERFSKFFHEFEDQIMNHKLWLDTKVMKSLKEFTKHCC